MEIKFDREEIIEFILAEAQAYNDTINKVLIEFDASLVGGVPVLRSATCYYEPEQEEDPAKGKT